MDTWDWRAMSKALILPALAWLAVVALATLLGYPGVIYATPAAWLLALPVGRTAIIHSRSQRLRTRLQESSLAGAFLGLLQGAAFLVVEVRFLGVQTVEGEVKPVWGVVIMVVGILLCGLLSIAIGARTDRMRRRRVADDPRLEVTSQYCPICKQPVPLSARYPRAVCSECASQAVDEHGRAVVFFNESLSGGLVGQYRDTGEEYHAQMCYIKGVSCRVEDAHLGGIVIYPHN